MKERPILFSSDMVRAILDGRKTQTRRIIKPQPDVIHNGEPYWNVGGYRAWRHRGIVNPMLMGTYNPLICKYGQPGDRNWVKETFIAGKGVGGYAHGVCPDTNPDGETIDVIYRADGMEVERLAGPWTPSIRMPRWASRITLEITGVRVERLQDISEEDAEAEGCKNSLHLQGGRFARENFEHLWWTINGDGSWEENPWVWVITFRKI